MNYGKYSMPKRSRGFIERFQRDEKIEPNGKLFVAIVIISLLLVRSCATLANHSREPSSKG